MSEQIQNIADIDLIVRILAGEASDSDMQHHHQLLNDCPAHADAYRDYVKVWDSLDKIDLQDSIDVSTEWKAFEKNTIHSAAKGKSSQKGKSIRLIPFSAYVMRFAAGLLLFMSLGLGAYWSYRNFAYKTVSSQMALVEVELPDGSKVSLNEHSSLRYPLKFRNSVREVELKGEAFFDVAPDKLKPFIISANHTRIEVVGTSFNVNTGYLSSNEVVVVVNTGKVSVSAIKDDSRKIILSPGMTGLSNPDEGILTMEKNADVNYLAWKTKILVFENKTLQAIIPDINRAYHAKLTISDSSIVNCPVTATFEGQSLDAVIKILQSTLDLEVQRKPDAIILSGDGC